jgi:hypothetical protein
MNPSRINLLHRPVTIEPITPARLAMLFPIGRRVAGRLVAKLDDDKYLLRLKGLSLIAQSSIDFEEGDAVTAIVLSTWPRLQLQVRDSRSDEEANRDASGAAHTRKALIDQMPAGIGAVRVDIRI